MNNSVFGRPMMIMRKYVDIKLVTDGAKLETFISKLNFNIETIFTDNLAAILMKKTSIKFYQPIYVRITILI
jgi:hypothetical protein